MKKLNTLFHGDKAIWIIFLFLCIISLIEVFSAASLLSYKSGSYWVPLIRHGLFLAVGAAIVVLIHNIPCRWFKLVPIFFIPLSVVLLLMLLLGLGVRVNEGARWMDIFGLRFQPSEIAKGSLVVATALVLSTMQTEKGADKKAFKYICWLAIPLCALIFPENLSTSGLLFGVIVLMMFIGRVSIKQLSKLAGIIILGVSLCVISLMSIPKSAEPEFSKKPLVGRCVTWKHRLMDHLEKKTYVPPEDFDLDKNGQVGHANIAIASSNIFGKMPGNSVERDFLSQAFSDFIYAIIIEELGLIGGAGVVFLYIVILFRAARIANKCQRNFPAFLVIGLALLLVSQAMLNMLVAVGLFPVTGQPLPLISRGGTSTLINCVYIGMILSVSRYIDTEDPNNQETQSADENVITAEFQKDKGLS
ncbi:MAG: FtsW/RodA/SpoVE family cell cycle protein [Bacteroidaceae bacterium]